jgi:hypothetical protein
MADALLEGAVEAGHQVELVDLNREMSGGFLRDCRRCRLPDGTCSIQDGYGELLTRKVASADGVVYATPLYWYGIAAVLKNFFDRMVCYLSASYPESEQVVAAMAGKRSALLLASEERYPALAIGVVAQLQEMSRYLDLSSWESSTGLATSGAGLRLTLPIHWAPRDNSGPVCSTSTTATTGSTSSDQTLSGRGLVHRGSMRRSGCTATFETTPALR